ncbi:MAG: class I SAM-dependent methyltransferase [Bacteroidota bacterium]
MSNENSLDFYNNFEEKFIKDYLTGNKRIESAIINLAPFIPCEAKNILDIGCGLGWSSHEFSKKFSNAKVEGIDFSPVLIEKASLLFQKENLSYKVHDITERLPEKKYDAVLMIDVYEHIPKIKRELFHQSLKEILNDQGRLIMACPSKFHQKHLKENNPKGLQPVDEDVDYNDIAQLANDIGGELINMEYRKIWRNFDYFYSVIELKPIYNSNYTLRSNTQLELEAFSSRRKRIADKLNWKIEIPSNRVSIRSLKTFIKRFLKSVK